MGKRFALWFTPGTNYALHNVVQWSINRMHSFSSSKSVENGDQKILISHFIFCKNQRFHKILLEIGIQCQRILLKTNSSLDSFVVESSKFQNFSIMDHSSMYYVSIFWPFLGPPTLSADIRLSSYPPLNDVSISLNPPNYVYFFAL